MMKLLMHIRDFKVYLRNQKLFETFIEFKKMKKFGFEWFQSCCYVSKWLKTLYSVVRAFWDEVLRQQWIIWFSQSNFSIQTSACCFNRKRHVLINFDLFNNNWRIDSNDVNLNNYPSRHINRRLIAELVPELRACVLNKNLC
jgi:hypothetical protein